jgi:hypothetical protein
MEQFLQPDARMQHLRLRSSEGESALSQSARHASVAAFELEASVPEDIRIHFDTARNLYLYAWFVYRFHVVAEQHVLGSLEMALRSRLISASILQEDGTLPLTPGRSRPDRPMLRKLLELASTNGLVSNHRFVNRFLWAQRLAENRRIGEQIQVMHARGLSEMTVAPAEITVTEADLNSDWIKAFIESLPRLRNTYAHGSSQLHPGVLRTFEISSDLINQLYT